MDMEHDQIISQLSSRLIYKNRWMSLREDKVRFPGGHEGIYSVVEKPDFVAIIPVHDDGKIELVSQYRYAVSGRYWELPQGAWEDSPDARSEDLARGELAEETGFRAGRMEKIGQMFAASGFVDQNCHMYLAQDLVAGEVSREATEHGMECAAFSLEEIKALIREGKMKDSISIGVLGYWQMLAR